MNFGVTRRRFKEGKYDLNRLEGIFMSYVESGQIEEGQQIKKINDQYHFFFER